MPETDLALLEAAAREAGKIGLRYFKATPEIWDKPDDQGPVTEADLAIDAMLKSELIAARPDYGWLSEETEDNTDRLAHEYVFIVDPIDGTRAFINGEQSWGVSIGLARGNDIIAGAFYMPVSDRMYAARSGAGATLNGKSIRHSGRKELAGASVMAQSSQLKPELWPMGLPEMKRHFRPSLAYRMCLVAEGRFDAMLTLRAAHEWDIAAGELICREAGALVSTQKGTTLRFNSEDAKLPDLIAATPDIHRALLAWRSQVCNLQSAICNLQLA